MDCQTEATALALLGRGVSWRRRPLNRRRWERQRRAVFERDDWRCVECGRAGRLECDHVVPLDRGGAPWDLENLATRCRRCHILKTAGENRRELTPEERRWREFVAELT